MRLTAFACLAVLLPTAAAAADPVQAILDEAAAACASFENGTFAAPPAAMTAVDLTGDGRPDTVVDELRFTCSTAASLYGGTGGSLIHAVVGPTRADFLTLGWKVIPMGQDVVLLMAVHGLHCDGTGSDPCFEAVTWNGDRFLSVRGPDE